jgi:predicted RND superfamily exporter protein
VERFSRRHYVVVFLLAALAIVLGGWLGSRLHIESNLLALIPAGNRQVDTLKEALEDFGSIDYLIVLIQAESEDIGPDELEDFADLYAERLEEQEALIEFVEYRFEPDSDFLELFYDNALLFLPPEQLPQIAEKLTDEAMLRQIEQNRLALATPTASFSQALIANDPLGLMPLFLNRLLGNRGVLKIDISDGYYLSADSKTLIMLVKPSGASTDLEFDKELMQSVREVEQETRQQLREEFETQSLGIRARYGGNYALAVDEAALIKKDVKFNLFVSMFAVAALYWLCYRRFAALLYSTLPLLVGQALTFGLAFFVLGGLNASSSAFTALLMGLGTDFVIVVYARYVEERRAGKSLAEATELMIGETGLGVFTGAITSAGTFYAMCISQFRGLKDLGFLIGSGILLCAVAILFMLPAMIKWNEGVRRRKVDAVKKLHLQSFFLEYLIPFSARHKRLVLGVLTVMTLGSLWLATRLDFDDTVSALRSGSSPALEVQQEMATKFGASLSYMMAIAEAETRDEAVALTEKITQRLRPFVESGLIGSYDSVMTYLPPESRQQAIIEALRSDETGAFDVERIRGTFLRGLDESGFRREAFDDFLGRMNGFLTPQRPIQLLDLENRGLDRLLERYVAVEEGRVRIVTYLYLADPKWRRRPPPTLVDTIVGDDAGIVVTGTNVVNREFRGIFLREAPQAVIIGFFVVFALLWVDFRSLKLTAIAMTQLICGVIIMLGMMKLTDVHLNYVNAFVATMILGVGIDYSIHLVHRLSLSGGKVEPGLLETGKAVVMAALTNIAGFGTLTLGSYPALRSFGIVALYGSLACLFTSLTLVPALMAKGPVELDDSSSEEPAA